MCNALRTENISNIFKYCFKYSFKYCKVVYHKKHKTIKQKIKVYKALHCDISSFNDFSCILPLSLMGRMWEGEEWLRKRCAFQIMLGLLHIAVCVVSDF